MLDVIWETERVSHSIDLGGSLRVQPLEPLLQSCNGSGAERVGMPQDNCLKCHVLHACLNQHAVAFGFGSSGHDAFDGANDCVLLNQWPCPASSCLPALLIRQRFLVGVDASYPRSSSFFGCLPAARSFTDWRLEAAVRLGFTQAAHQRESIP